MSTYSRLSVVSLIIAAAALATLPAAPLPGPVGFNQRVAIVVCAYEGSDDVPFTSQEIADRANDVINEFFMGATGSRVNFDFIAVPGVCQFDYTYEDTAPADTIRGFLGVDAEDPNVVNDVLEGFKDLFDTGYDPFVLYREGRDVVQFAEAQVPGIYNSTTRILFVLNRDKRAMSTMGHYPIYQTSQGPFTALSVAMIDTGNASEDDLSTAAHELGHQLGLPDLYREGPGEARFVESWGHMAWDRNQNFTGWSRHHQGWVSPNRVITITPDYNVDLTETFTIGPPNSNSGDAEILRLNAASVMAGSLPEIDLGALPPYVADLIGFAGFIVEARPGFGQDANLPDDYESGVLVTWIDPIGNALIPTIRPVFVQAHQTTTSSDPDGDPDGDWFTRAAFNPGEAFVDEDTGVTLIVDQANPNGSYDVTLIWEAPPRPNLVARDTWLDSPGNGFGNLDAPATIGDLATVRVRIRWQDNDPFPDTPILPPEITVPIHRQVFEIANTGDLVAEDVQATIMVLQPEIPMAFDLEDPETLLPFALVDRQVDLGDINPGQSTTVFLEHRPEGPFVASMFVAPGHNEAPLDLWNNVLIEPFILAEVSFGSPYDPVDVDLNISNLNEYPNIIIVTPSIENGIPSGWTAEMDRTVAAVGSNRSQSFNFHAELPDPNVAKPGVMESVYLTGWMNYGDTYIPITTWPVHVALNHPTRLTLEAEDIDKPATGELSYLTPENTWTPLPESRVNVTVTGSDGSIQNLSDETDERGEYSVEFEGEDGVSYALIADYQRVIGYKSSQSPHVIIEAAAATAAPEPEEEPDEPVVRDPRVPGPVLEIPGMQRPSLAGLDINSVRTREGAVQRGTVTLSRSAPRGGAQVTLEARPAEMVSIPDTVTVRAGQSEATFDIDVTGRPLRATRVTITATMGRESQSDTMTVGPATLEIPDRVREPIQQPIERVPIDRLPSPPTNPVPPPRRR